MAISIALLDEALRAILACEDAPVPMYAHMINHVGLFLGGEVARRARPGFVHSPSRIVPLFLLHVADLWRLILHLRLRWQAATVISLDRHQTLPRIGLEHSCLRTEPIPYDGKVGLK